MRKKIIFTSIDPDSRTFDFVDKTGINGREFDITIMHDYIKLSGFSSIGAATNVAVHQSINIGIRDLVDFVLPLIQKHPEVDIKRIHANSNYIPPYNRTYNFFDKESNRYKVAVFTAGDPEPNICTLDFFDKVIKPNLKD